MDATLLGMSWGVKPFLNELLTLKAQSSKLYSIIYFTPKKIRVRSGYEYGMGDAYIRTHTHFQCTHPIPIFFHFFRTYTHYK